MFHSTPENLRALELAVESAAELHEKRSYRDNGYTRFFHLGEFGASYPDLSVKYTDHEILKAENLTLEYLYTLACEDGDAAPHVPRPAHYFHRPGGLGYIVMERIELHAVSDDELQTKAAEAVRWLRTKRPPAWALFGSMGKTHAEHTVFHNFTAPRIFKSVSAAEKYTSFFYPFCAANFPPQAVDRIRRRPWIPITEITLVNEDIVLTQSDMNAGDFGVAYDGRAVLFDAATIQALPVTLADYTLLRTTSFATAVSKHVFDADKRAALLVSPNVLALAEVRQYLFMIADDSLGVDEDGNRSASRRTARGIV